MVIRGDSSLMKMGRSVARWPNPHLKESTFRNLYKCSCYDCLRSDSELDVVVVSIYQNLVLYGGSLTERKAYTFGYTSILVRPHQKQPDPIKLFVVEAPGTAPGSAILTHCAVYRHSWQASTLYIGRDHPFEKREYEHFFTGQNRTKSMNFSISLIIAV